MVRVSRNNDMGMALKAGLGGDPFLSPVGALQDSPTHHDSSWSMLLGEVVRRAGTGYITRRRVLL
jgi:hypothetical protein